MFVTIKSESPEIFEGKNIIYEVKIKVHLHVHLKTSLLQVHRVHSSGSYLEL